MCVITFTPLVRPTVLESVEVDDPQRKPQEVRLPRSQSWRWLRSMPFQFHISAICRSNATFPLRRTCYTKRSEQSCEYYYNTCQILRLARAYRAGTKNRLTHQAIMIEPAVSCVLFLFLVIRVVCSSPSGGRMLRKSPYLPSGGKCDVFPMAVDFGFHC